MKAIRIKEVVSEFVTILVCVSAILLFTSCAQPQATRTTTASKPIASVPKVACSESTGGLIKLSKSMPVEATLGLEFLTELTVTATGCAANVVVRDTVPPGVSYARSEPAATVEDDQLV